MNKSPSIPSDEESSPSEYVDAGEDELALENDKDEEFYPTVKRRRSPQMENDNSSERRQKKERKNHVTQEEEPDNSEIKEPEIFVDSSILKPFTGSCLPYELTSLTWNRNHTRNSQNTYCYCGKPRSKWSVMLNCRSCRQWFHTECLKMKPHPTPLLGDWSYQFKCSLCTKDSDSYLPIGKNWTDIVRVAIYNLLAQEKQRGSPKRFFQYKDEICSFIDKNWDSLCFEKTRTKTWENTIGSALSTKSHYFKSGADSIGSSGYWGLRHEEDPGLVRESAKNFPKNKEKKKKSNKVGSSKKKEDKITKRKVKPVPAVIYYPKLYFDPKSYGYTEFCLAKENSAPQVKIFPDRLTASNEKV